MSTNRRLTRNKRLLTIGASIVAMGTLASCASSGGGEADGQSTITVLGYTAIFEDNFTQAVIEGFEAQHPEYNVEYVPSQNSAEMLGKLRSEASNPTVDVAILDQSVANTGIQEGVFAQLDEAAVPNLANVVDMGLNAEGYGPAMTFDNLVLLVNPEEAPEEISSIQDLWDAPDNSVAIPAAPDIQGIALTALTANNLGADYQEDIQPAIDELALLQPKVTSWDPQPDVYQTVTSGSAQYAVGWNARGQVFSDQSDGRLQVVQPDDGIAFQVNTINMVEGTENAEGAQAFIDYTLSKESQESFSSAMFYAPTVKNALLPEEVQARVADPQDPNIVEIDWIWMADQRDAWTDLWRRTVIGG